MIRRQDLVAGDSSAPEAGVVVDEAEDVEAVGEEACGPLAAETGSKNDDTFAHGLDLREPDGTARPLYSVIVPTLQAGEQIGATLDSILAQDGAALECLVVDGGSRDDTLARVALHQRRAGSRRIRVESAPDAGIYDAMNRGIRRSRGRYLYFLGAGDRLRPGVLGRLRDVLVRERPDFVYGRVYLQAAGRTGRGECTPRELARFNICHQAVLYRRELFARAGLYDPAYPVFADYEFNLRCFGRADLRRRFVDTVVADYRGGGRSDHGDARFEAQREALIERHLGAAVLADFRRWRDGRAACVQGVRRSAAAGGRWAIYGAGGAGARLLEHASLADLHGALDGFFDSDPAKWGGTLAGRPVRQPSPRALGAVSCIVIASDWRDQIRADLLARGVPAHRLFDW